MTRPLAPESVAATRRLDCPAAGVEVVVVMGPQQPEDVALRLQRPEGAAVEEQVGELEVAVAEVVEPQQPEHVALRLQ